MPNMSANDDRVLEGVTGAPMLDQTLAWSAINSGSANLTGLTRMADTLADAFSILPGELSLEESEPVEQIDAAGRSSMIRGGRNLHLRVRADAPVQLLLTGHMDTVFPADHVFQQTLWIEPGKRLNGPGVADMKGGLAVMLAALQAIEQDSASQRLGYEVVINSDEEVGSGGSASLIRGAALGKHAALTYEPALPSGMLAGARPGTGNFSLVVTGRAAHAGRNPEDGRNAIVAAADLACRLAALKRPGLSVNPARIDGGGPNNIVPDKAILRVNLRPAGIADQADAEAAIARIIEDVGKARDVGIHLHGGFGRPPKPLDAQAERLFTLVRQCGERLGIAVEWQSTGGVCDGNNIAACGVPVVDTMGVRGGNIHSEYEFLIVESLVERAQLSALVLLRLAEGQLP
jgi:glutamate carboxypeptidase